MQTQAVYSLSWCSSSDATLASTRLLLLDSGYVMVVGVCHVKAATVLPLVWGHHLSFYPSHLEKMCVHECILLGSTYLTIWD